MEQMGAELLLEGGEGIRLSDIDVKGAKLLSM